MDTDIPMAYGTAIPMAVPKASAPPAHTYDLRTATSINGGRSSRVLLPNQNEKPRLTNEMRKALKDQGYTEGLAEALIKNKIAFPLSIWVVDNSGSMANRDGHRIVETAAKSNIKLVSCTRWAEMQQTVEYHIQMAALLRNPTVFRLLNDPGKVAGPQQFSVAERDERYLSEDVAIAQQVMLNAAPSGVTPLTEHIHEIRENVRALEPSLRSDGTKVVLVLATDGLPSNYRGISDAVSKREFEEALRSLEGMPVWIVIRLCTDEEEVVKYWSDLDAELELSLEVIDDFVGEAEEVNSHNKWLNYGLPLQRMREMGFHSKLFDLLDEQQLSKGELRDFCRILFGDNLMDGVPDPEADWKGFYRDIQRLVEGESKTWNPVKRRLEPWIDMKRLKKDYGGGWLW